MVRSKGNTRVLIVDDDEAVRSTMNEYIQTAGYNSEAVSCAEEALEIIEKRRIPGHNHRYHTARHGWAGIDQIHQKEE